MNEKINTQHLVDAFIQKQGMERNQANAFVKEFFSLIIEALEKERYLKIKGLGTFKLIEVDSRESVNINTGERFELQGHTKISFTPENPLKDLVNKPFSHFESVVLNEGVTFDDMFNEEEEQSEDSTQPEEINSATPATETTVTEETISEEIIVIEEETPIVEEEVSVKQEETPLQEQETSVSEEKETEIIPETIVQEEETEKEKPIEDSAYVEPASAEKENPLPVNEAIVPPLKETNKAPQGMKYFTVSIVAILLLCIGIIAYLYFPDMTDSNTPQAPLTEGASVVTKTEQNHEAEPPVKSIQTTDTIHTSPTVTEAKPKSEPKKEIPVATSIKTSKEPVIPDSVSYIIVGTQGTHTIVEGETLTRVALKYYGTKNLWPYLVKHNPTIIKNPNHVPYGTTIKVPKLEKKQ